MKVLYLNLWFSPPAIIASASQFWGWTAMGVSSNHKLKFCFIGSLHLFTYFFVPFNMNALKINVE